MTEDGWKNSILQAVSDYHKGDPSFVNLIVEQLMNVQQAQRLLVKAGLAHTGEGVDRIMGEIIKLVKRES